MMLLKHVSLGLCAVMIAHASQGSDIYFTGPNGLWTSTSSWNDGAGPVPGSDDVARFDPGPDGARIAMLDQQVTHEVSRLIVESGTTELRMQAVVDTILLRGVETSLLTPALLVQSAEPGGSATLQVTSGVAQTVLFRITMPSVAVGMDSGRHGHLLMSAQNRLLDCGARLDVGRFGTGLVEIAGSSRVRAQQLDLGGGMSGDGTYVGLDASRATIDGLTVVGGFGSGTVLLAGDARMDVERLIVGRSEGSNGMVMIDGAGALLVVDDLFEIGQFGSGLMEVRGGAGVLALSALTIGFLDDVNAEMTIDGGGTLVWVLGDVWTRLICNSPSIPEPQLTLSDGGQLRAEGLVGGNDACSIIRFSVGDRTSWQGVPALDARGGIEVLHFVVDIAPGFNGLPGDQFLLARVWDGPMLFTEAPVLHAPPGLGWSATQDGDDLVATVTLAADLNGDGVVDFADLLELLGAWGTCDNPQRCPADLTGDGVVDFSDLVVLLNWFGAAG